MSQGVMSIGKGHHHEGSAWTRDRSWRHAGPLAQAEGERWVQEETPGRTSAEI